MFRHHVHRYLSAEAARAIAIQIANATFAARSTELWGQGSTAVASDSTHVRAYDQNLFTEWHSRPGGRGVLIYWHVENWRVEKKSLAIHSQVIDRTAFEVAAMVGERAFGAGRGGVEHPPLLQAVPGEAVVHHVRR
ncbi:Tn3 family transposase [Streptomyces sp. NPDC056930]|uniref:Tn3 family transposase n=1 Tax=Streptomyces sp. NPDC056930 TaxID=3345967 RepID=UPI00364490FF